MSDPEEVRTEGMNTGVLQTYCGNPYAAGVIRSQCDRQTPSRRFLPWAFAADGMLLWDDSLEGAFGGSCICRDSDGSDKSFFVGCEKPRFKFGERIPKTLAALAGLLCDAAALSFPSSQNTAWAGSLSVSPKIKTPSAGGEITENKKETKRKSLL